jgi:hypothetical protein
MNEMFGGFVASMAVACATLSCAADAPADLSDEAPAVEADELDSLYYGTEWNGWTHAPFATVTYIGAPPWVPYFRSGFDWGTTFTRNSGSEPSRGGGVCLVSKIGGSCSSDADCGAEQPNGWFNYCGADPQNGANTCFVRPGTRQEMCIQDPGRAPGTYYGGGGLTLFDTFVARMGGGNTTMYALGCMTTTPGPGNTNCGSTSSNLYVRTIVPLITSF